MPSNIAIGLPVYNGEKLVSEALDSLPRIRNCGNETNRGINCRRWEH